MCNSEYVHTTEQVGRFTVKIVADDMYRGWDFPLCDEPMMVVAADYRGYGYRYNVQHDNTKRLSESVAKARIAYERGGLNTVFSDTSVDVYPAPTERQPGRVKIVASVWDYRPRYFSTEDRAAAAVFEAEYEFKLADVCCERFDRQGDTFWLVWMQSELDEYAGLKGANPPRESVRHWLDGDVWGYVIGDEDDDHLDSCWGFIGDADDCLEAGREVAEGMEARARQRDAEAYAVAMYEARPDLTPAYA